TPVYEKQGPKWCIASPGGPRRVQTYPGLGSTTRMPFSPDTGKPRTARRGRENPHGSGSKVTPLTKHLLSQQKQGEGPDGKDGQMTLAWVNQMILYEKVTSSPCTKADAPRTEVRTHPDSCDPRGRERRVEMASSSLSQEDVDHELEVQSSRRTRIRTARANAVARGALAMRECSAGDCDSGAALGACPEGSQVAPEQHDASPKPCARAKDKRCPPRPNHPNKCKAQRERRKLREKRRSTGVVHLQSTESTGGSTGEEEEELLSMSAETRRNTALNEVPHEAGFAGPADGQAPQEVKNTTKAYPTRNNKSPSDLDADDEDNQDYDSAVNQSDSALSLAQDSNHSSGPTSSSTGGGAHLPPKPQGGLSNGTWEAMQRKDEALERSREESRNLVQLVREKEVRIHNLERKVLALTKELSEVTAENRELREMNSALLDGVPLSTEPAAK
ncbi:hypothetical protein HPB47_024417, partial [Ixodes persulcatus]